MNRYLGHICVFAKLGLPEALGFDMKLGLVAAKLSLAQACQALL